MLLRLRTAPSATRSRGRTDQAGCQTLASGSVSVGEILGCWVGECGRTSPLPSGRASVGRHPSPIVRPSTCCEAPNLFGMTCAKRSYGSRCRVSPPRSAITWRNTDTPETPATAPDVPPLTVRIRAGAAHARRTTTASAGIRRSDPTGTLRFAPFPELQPGAGARG